MTTPPNDASLCIAAAGGDRSAFAVLVERHQGLVRAVTFAALGDRALAEDAAQETFVAAWRQLVKLRDPARFRSWVCGIARNLSVSTSRSRQRERPEPDEILDLRGDDLDLEQQLGEQQQAALVWKALERVPTKYREVLVLYYREERSAQHVAGALGISVAAVEQRLSRGRKHLERGVERLVERSLARHRTNPGFALAVVAGLPHGSPLATISRATRSTRGWAAIVLTGIATAVVGFHAIPGPTATDAASSADAASSTLAKPRASDSAANALVVLGPRSTTPRPEGPTLRSARPGEHPESEAGSPGPAHFELTRVSPTKVAVNLHGGRSNAFDPGPVLHGEDPVSSDPLLRNLRGQVLDDRGIPIAGAIVVAGRHLRVSSREQLTADTGDVADERGRFTVPLLDHEPTTIVALRPGEWSTPTRIQAGHEDVNVTLQLAASGRVEGDLLRRGAAIQGTVHVAVRGASFTAATQTDAEGHYRTGMLPPGPIRILASARHDSDATGYPLATDEAVLEPGSVLRNDFEIPVGAMVEAVAELEALHQPFFMYTLLPGNHAITDVTAFDKAIGHIPLDRRQRVLVTSDDKTDPAVFGDVQAGSFTVCVEPLERANGHLEPIAVVCTSLVVDELDRVYNVRLPPLPSWPSPE